MIRLFKFNSDYRSPGALLCALFIVLACTVLIAPGARALEVAGVDVPETMATPGDGTALVLNGAGIRKKFIIKVYVGALYLTGKHKSVQAVLDAPGPKAVTMKFLYKKVDAGKLASGWTDGFRKNLPADSFKTLSQRLAKFNSFFIDAVKGDKIRLLYVPGAGTEVRHNGRLLGSVEGEDFVRALLLVWLGKSPADDGLKAAMLGGG